MHKNKVVVVQCELRCEWHDVSPRYRAFVDGELFTERTWIWDDVLLREDFQIRAVPGKYQIRYQLLDPAYGQLWVRDWQIVSGAAQIDQQGNLEIM
jgi:hypothetical protein